MQFTYMLILVLVTFTLPLAGINPLLSDEARLFVYDLWLDKGVPLNLGVCLGLFTGAGIERDNQNNS